MAGDGNLWILGVVLVLAGSIMQNLGNNLMSLGHEQQRVIDAKKEAEEKLKLAGEEGKSGDSGSGKGDGLTDPASADVEGGEVKKRDEGDGGGTWWFIGTVCFVIGSLSTFVAFGFGAQSLLAALESVQFVTNVIFAKTVHNEAISFKMLASTASIVLGCIFVVIFSTHSSKKLNGEDIQKLLINTPFVIWLAFSFVGWCSTEYTFRYYKRAREAGSSLWKHTFVEPLAFCLASAFVGALAVVGAKCIAMLIIGGDNEWGKGTLWVTLVTWLALVFYWLRRLDWGFELFPPLFVIPVIQCFFIFFAIICGGIFFEEFTAFSDSQYAGFFSGVALIVCGVVGLAPTDIDSLVVPVNYDVEQELARIENAKLGAAATAENASRNSALDEKLAAMEGDVNLFAAADVKTKPGAGNGVTKDGEGSPPRSSRKIVKRGDSLDKD